MELTGTVLKYQPDQVLCHNDFVESSDMGVYKLSVMVDLAGKVRIVFSRGFKNHLMASHSRARHTHPEPSPSNHL